jgi:hypothetical protein
MAEKLFNYPALLVRQGPNAPPLLLFSASAVEMDQWVGIPQKTTMLEGETLGFQRDSSPARVEQIAKFYREPRNVIHNPLLCAIREALGIEVSFKPTSKAKAEGALAVPGSLTIKMPDRSEVPLVALLHEARVALEKRVPQLKKHAQPTELVAKLRKQYEAPIRVSTEEEDLDDEFDEDAGDEAANGAVSPEEALFEESHIGDFWCQLRAREVLLGQLGDQFQDKSFLGFGREAVESYLRPIVLVDGQHRLLGALKAARDSVDEDPNISSGVTASLRSGRPREQVSNKLLIQRARRLPISMLLDPAPGEHVFQFVVVNQKATPVRPALLATIISTSLSEAELEPITDRLENAGVPLMASRAISYLTKNQKSPFADRVTRGLSQEGADLLPWTVLGQLVAIFRDLKGAKFFHDQKMDYADIWRRRYLLSSKILTIDVDDDIKKAHDAWKAADGPWRDVFIAFWWAVRAKFGDSVSPEAPNYWGKPRTSNLFNKPSLLTLATDFFAYLVETRMTIESADGVTALVDEWLLDVDLAYFARDWKLANIKKDSSGTRKQWSKLWYGYRRDPKSLPNIKSFSLLYKES